MASSTVPEKSTAEKPVAVPDQQKKSGPPPPGDNDPGGKPPANDDGAIWCPICEMWLSGPAQWEDHLIGKKHRKNVVRASRRDY